MKKVFLISALFFQLPCFAKMGHIDGVTSSHPVNKRPPQYFSTNFEKEYGRWQLKNLENSFKKFSGNLYMAETEVTNQQYNYYLTYLLEQKDFNTLMLVKAEKTDWRTLLPDSLKTRDDKAIFPNGHPDGAYFPAQNMSFEAAKQYCAWLTNFYNNEPIEKRKWKKVLFRLPTQEEWMQAARGQNDTSIMYPWGFNRTQSKKGCFLSNFNCSNENCHCEAFDKVFDKLTKDGALFTAKADTYYPNDFGLYGMSGNIAEMTATQGIAKGGSWEDAPAACTIQAQKNYSAPSPAIGFRILMEIVE
jgi:formylglycine-generating enzyme required for sulfatase activity